MYENARKYNLTGTDAMVFEALVSLCKKTGSWKGSFATLARYSCCGDRTTAKRTFLRLLSMGIIVQNAQNTVQIAHETVQNATNPKEKGTEKENINNKKSLPAIIACDKPSDDGWLAGFNLFWSNFNPSKEFIRRKNACLQIWQKMPQDWRTLATERAAEHSPERNNPLFFLRDEDFLQTPSTDAPQEKDEPKNWNGHDLESGVEYVTAKYKGRWGTYTKADADKFSLPTK